MYRSVQGLLQVATETSEIAALPARLTAFVAQIATIDELDRAQNMPTHGRVEDRDAQLQELVEQTLELAGYAASHAKDHGLHDIAAQVNVSSADFRRLRITRRPGLAQQVCDAIVPFVGQLAGYGVTAETLTQFQTAIAAAKKAVTEPRATVSAKRTATATMAKAFVEADEMLALHIDPLLFPLRKTHPEFYADYRGRREVLARPGAPMGGTAAAMPPAAASPASATAADPTNTALAA